MPTGPSIGAATVCIGECHGYHAWMLPADRAEYVKNLASSLGFDRCGIALAKPIGRVGYLKAWLGSKRCGSMEYLRQHFNQRADPAGILEGARSVIVVALLYHSSLSGCSKPPTSSDRSNERGDRVATNAGGDGDKAQLCGPRGRVAMYAWGDDYHKVVKTNLLTMADRMRAELPEPFEFKACVDTAPLGERELAAAAGVGWIGKNTLVLDRRLGSYFFLGVLVTTLELTPDEPVPNRCGTCTACLDACPTRAFPAPYEMDASRCISYLTIEHRGLIPHDVQVQMGNWIFGCDICQRVCPYNRRAPVTREPHFTIRTPGPRPALDDILSWSAEEYREKLRGSAMTRATLDMLQRNARIAMENIRRERGLCETF